MVSLRGDISDGKRIDSVEVTVLEAEPVFNAAVAWVLTVTDVAGNEFEVKIWHTHEVDRWWQAGWRYVLEQGLGTRRSDGSVILHSTSDFSVQQPEGVVDLFVVGDSHIGRENRPANRSNPYHTGRQFVAAMGYAARYDVDAVIHAGDLFDDDPRPVDITLARSGFDVLDEYDLRFYFIYGNHGVDAARSFYESLEKGEATHLSTDGVNLGGTVGLYGMDHGAESEFANSATTSGNTPGNRRRILVAHDEFFPPREDGIPIDVVSSPKAPFDYLLSGHLHDPESGSASGTNVQYLGSTARISANPDAADQAGWLVRVTPETVDLSRVDVE